MARSSESNGPRLREPQQPDFGMGYESLGDRDRPGRCHRRLADDLRFLSGPGAGLNFAAFVTFCKKVQIWACAVDPTGTGSEISDLGSLSSLLFFESSRPQNRRNFVAFVIFCAILPPMLRQASHELRLSTRGRGLYEITSQVTGWLARNNFQTGLVTLHLRHTSASLLIQENADPDVRTDLEQFFSRLVPDGDSMFIHTAEGEDDMPAHIRTALTTVNLSIPMDRGRLALGTWQGIYLWEHRHAPHSRTIALHFIGE